MELNECDCFRLIPGPDPGACSACGEWRKAGMLHACDPAASKRRRMRETELLVREVERLRAADEIDELRRKREKRRASAG